MTRKTKTQKSDVENASKPTGFTKIFFLIAPILGLFFGYLYTQNSEIQKHDNATDRVYQEYKLTDREIIKIIKYKLEKGDNEVSDWFTTKVTYEVESKLKEIGSTSHMKK